MTVKELREEIRRLTSSVNEKLKEYRAHNLGNRFFEKQLNRLKASTAYVDRTTGEIKVPASRSGGELGLGFKGKVKSDLEVQYRELKAFDSKEWQSVKAIKQRSARAVKAHETFAKRYGDISFDDWEDFVLMMGDVAEYVNDFGYEDIGGSIARLYTESRDKQSFSKAVREASHRASGKGLTPEDFIDVLTEVLFEEGAIDE